MHRLCLAGLILLFSATTVAQDIHFSQFYHNPVFQGPGMVGMFDGESSKAVEKRFLIPPQFHSESMPRTWLWPMLRN
jgi:hypothetical protein